jgi:hypothetical protein
LKVIEREIQSIEWTPISDSRLKRMGGGNWQTHEEWDSDRWQLLTAPELRYSLLCEIGNIDYFLNDIRENHGYEAKTDEEMIKRGRQQEMMDTKSEELEEVKQEIRDMLQGGKIDLRENTDIMDMVKRYP